MFKNKNNIQENNFQNNDFDVGAGMNFDFNENTENIDSSFNGDNQGTPMPNLNGTPLVSNKKQKKVKEPKQPKQPKQLKQPKQPKQPKQSKQPKQVNSFNMENGYNMDNMDSMNSMNNIGNMPNMPQNNKRKKKFNPIFIILPIILILILIIGSVVIGKMKANSNNVEKPPITESNTIVENDTENASDNISENTSDNPSENTSNIEENTDTEDNNEPVEPIEPKYSYENDMIGIKFNYDSNLYIKENVEEIFNTLKEVIPEGRDEFNIFSDKVTTLLPLAKLMTGDADGLYISVSLIPFDIDKETTILKIDGSTEVKNESIEAINLTDEELVEKYDIQIKNSITQSGCEIISYDKSVVNGVGSEEAEGSTDGTKRFKGIFTNRVYSGPTDLTSSTGVVEVSQCTIPVGKNAIMVTAVTDGRPIEIDKSAILNEIVNSLVVTTRGPIVEESEEVVETTDSSVVDTKN